MKRTKTRILLCILLCLSLVSADALSLLANSQFSGYLSRQSGSEKSREVNGEFVVSVFSDRQWQEAGRLAYDMFLKEESLDLSGYLEDGSQAAIKITQDGGEAAHLDSVLLGGEAPESVNSGDELLLQKLSVKDLDLTNVAPEGIELIFPANRSSDILSIVGRIEGERISKEPFKFPSANTYKEISENSEFYSYKLNSVNRKLTLDGNLEEVESLKPLFKELCIPGTGHPDGYTYSWVMNDDEYLYVVMDFTPDNTMDGDKDYSKLHVKTDAGIKEFKVSVPETTWGLPSFTYTDKVEYQHKVYEFKIPLSEFGNIGNDTLSLAFSAYGTAAPPVQIDGYYDEDEDRTQPSVAYDPLENRYLIVYTNSGHALEDNGIMGQFITNDAAIDGERIPIGVRHEGDPFSKVYPDVANGDGMFLAVWINTNFTNYKVMGRFIAADGSFLTDEFDIDNENSSIREFYLSVAYGDDGKFLVVWSDDDNVVGRMVSLDKSTETNTEIVSEEIQVSLGDYFYRSPSVDYSEESGKFLVAWDDDRESSSDYNIYGRLVNIDGSPEPSEISICTVPHNQFSPSVTYDSNKKEFFLIWGDEEGVDNEAINYGIYGNYVDPDGDPQIVGDGELIVDGTDTSYIHPTIVYSGIREEYLPIWVDTPYYGDEESTTFGRGQQLDKDLEEAGTRLTFGDGIYAGASPLDLAPSSEEGKYLVVYPCSYLDYNWDRQIDYLKWDLVGDEIEHTPKLSINPALAFNPDEDNYLLVYSNHEYDIPTIVSQENAERPTGETSYTDDLGIIGQFISNDADAQGDPFLIGDSSRDNIYRSLVDYPDIAYGDGQYLVVWAEEFEDPDMSYMKVMNIMGNFLDPDGKSYANDPFTIAENVGYNGENFFENNLNVTYGEEGKFLVAYSDGEDILGRIVALDEADTAIDICSFENYQSAPSVSYSPTAHKFLVVWQDDRDDNGSEGSGNPGSNLYGRLFGKDGEIDDPDADDLAICTSVKGQYGPSVAYNSTSDQFAVTWYEVDNETEEDRIFGKHFNTDGLPVEDAEKLLISKPDGAGPQEYRHLSTVYNPTLFDEYFSVWSTLDYDEYDTWGMGQRISNDLVASGSIYDFGEDIYNEANEQLDIACNTNLGNYLVAYPCKNGFYEEYSANNSNEERSYAEYCGYIKWELIGDEAPANPGRLQFKEVYNVDEDCGKVNVAVERAGGDAGEATVKYQVIDDSAETPDDYTVAGDILEFADGDKELKFIEVTINDDQDIENEEYILLELYDVRGAEPGEVLQTYVYINDNDTANVKFSSPTYTVAEDVYGKYIGIPVIFSGFPIIPAEFAESNEYEETVFSVVYETSDGTAKADEDYKAVSGILNFGWQASEITFRVPIIDDSTDESNETVNLKLSFLEPEAYRSSASEGDTIWVSDYPITLGAPKTATLTILDNDSSPPSDKPRKSSGSSSYVPPVVVETPPPTEGLPNDALVDRMPGYVPLSTPTKINEVKSEISLSYNKATLAGSPGHDARIYYWRPEVKKWVALATYPDGDGKVKAINDGGYSGWFVVFGVVQPHFSDVSSSWAEQLINRMNGLGLIEGYEVKGSDLRVAKPEQKVTRAEFTMFVVRIMNMNPDNILLPNIPDSEVESILSGIYSDAADISPWVRAAVAKATKAGLVPFKDSSFNPLEPITRIEAGVMVSRALKKFKDFKNIDLTSYMDSSDIPGWAVGEVVENALEGYPDNTLRPNVDIARAESLAMLLRLFIKGLGW